MSFSRPLCAEYTVKIVSREDGSFEDVDLSSMLLSFNIISNEIGEATLTGRETESFCCECRLEPWCYELHVYRDDVRMASFDFYKILRDPTNGSDVLYFKNRMGLAYSRAWMTAIDTSADPVILFERVIAEANKLGDLDFRMESLGSFGHKMGMINGLYDNLSDSFDDITGAHLDWFEYSHGGRLNVLRYGNILHDTGYEITADDWEEGLPTIGVDGSTNYSAVIVKSDSEEAEFLGYWPKTSDGGLDTSGGKVWLPFIVLDDEIQSTGEAVAVAKRLWERSTGVVFGEDEDISLSSNFGMCLSELVPGAVFTCNIVSGCLNMTGKYALREIKYDVVGGYESSVSLSLYGLKEGS